MYPSKGHPIYRKLHSGPFNETIELHGTAPKYGRRNTFPDSTTEILLVNGKNDISEWDKTCHTEVERRHHLRSAFSGWRGGIVMCIILAASVLCVNIAFLIWGVLKGEVKNGLGVAYRGNSESMDRLTRVIHLIVNILGTLLLGASNYSMQIMLAPTREEVDLAHQKRDWVDIGSQSLRNLKFISKERMLLCFVLAVSSIPLHLLYNSTIFPTLGANEYFAVVITEDFFMKNSTWSVKLLDSNRTKDFWQNPDTKNTFTLAFESLKEAHPGIFQNMSTNNCMEAYSVPFQNEHRSVLVVLHDPPLNSTFRAYHSMPFDATPGAWLCEKYSASRYGASCTLDATKDANSWTMMDKAVDYCLAEPGPQNICRINFSLPLLLAVIAANAVKLFVMVVILCRYNRPTIVTLGDGIASFLERPDPATKAMCLWTKKRFRERTEWRQVDRWSNVPRRYDPKSYPKSSGSAATKVRWNITVGLLIAILATTVVFFLLAVKDLKDQNSMQDTNMSGLWGLGLGTVKTQSIITKTMDAPVPSLVMLANLPQIALSTAYILINRILSAMAAAREWASFAHTRKGLRVTVPRGQQRSTLWLQLPYRFAVPQLALSALLHYFVSQSLFLAQIAVFDALGKEDVNASVSSIGFSAIGIFCALLTTAVVTVLLVATGLLACCREGMVPVGFCSAAIAAACHPPEWEKKDVATGLVRWGDVLAKDGFVSAEDVHGPVGHCSFSAEKVALPEIGKLYA